MSVFEDEGSILSKQMKEELEKEEAKMEDGSMVSNMEAICQKLIDMSLNGNLEAIDYIAKLIKE
jgi:hypothetical protein